MLLAGLALLLALQPTRPFTEERLLLDRRLETLRRILPDGPNAAADTLLVRELATAARLTGLQVQARPPVETAGRGELVLELTALGGYEEVDRFFQRIALSHRLIDVETLTMRAATEDVLQLTAVVRLPYWPESSPLPPAPDSPQPSGLPRATLRAFLHDQALAFAKSDAVAERRRARRTPRLFLAELAAVTGDRPVTLAYASLSDGFTLRGLALGEGPLSAFASRLERGFFRVSDFLIAKQGACHRFETHGSAPSVGPDAQLPIPASDPFETAAAACRVDRDVDRTDAIRAGSANAKRPGSGPLTLRLRDVDLADTFLALSALGFGGYVVDEAVTDRVDVEITQTTLAEALKAIRKAAGVELIEVGSLLRVTRERAAERPAEPSAVGPLTSVAAKRGEVRDLLATMAEVDPALASLGPPGFLGRVSAFVSEAPAVALRAAVLAAAGLTERIDEGRRIVERTTGAGEAPTPVARGDMEPRLVLRRDQLTVREFALAGVGSVGERRVAFAYGPTGELYSYAPGDRLFDAVVRTIDSGDVLLETGEGPLRVTLPPLSR